MNKTVSIIIRTQYRTVLLQRAVESVNLQTHLDWELIVVNDGGNPDAIEKVVSQTCVPKSRIKFLHHPKPIGRCASGNSAIPITLGRFIVFLDDDDTWENTFLEKTVNFLINNPEYGAVITQVNRIGEEIKQGKILHGKVTPFLYQPNKVSLFDLAEKNFIPMHSILFPKVVGEKFGYFDTSLKLLEDWDLFLKIASEFEIGVIPERLANYHFRTQSDDPVYINSVTLSKNECLYFETYLRNKNLRRDLEKGELGLGILMNLSYGIREMSFWNTLKGDFERLRSFLCDMFRIRNKNRQQTLSKDSNS